MFEHPNAFENDVTLSGGEIKYGAIVLVSFIDGEKYVTQWCERTKEPAPVTVMFECIIRRADSVEQLAVEIEGYNRGLGDRGATKIALYRIEEAAKVGNDLSVTIIENGKLVASDDDLKKGRTVRVEYERGESWFYFALNEDNV